MRVPRRGCVALLATFAVLLTAPSVALAQSADVIDADVTLRLAPDASLLVSERLTLSGGTSGTSTWRT
jgi:hypothetical protein